MSAAGLKNDADNIRQRLLLLREQNEILKKQLDEIRGLQNAQVGTEEIREEADDDEEEEHVDSVSISSAAPVAGGGGAAAVAEAEAAAAARAASHSSPSLSAQESNIIWPFGADRVDFWKRAPCKTPMPVGPGWASSAGGAGWQIKPDPVPLQIAHITAEMAPHAKVGGLGDVVTGLAKATRSRGHNVQVVMPFYECLPDSVVTDLRLDTTFDVPSGRFWDGRAESFTRKYQAWRGSIEGVEVILLRPDWAASSNCNHFKGERIYGGSYNEVEAYLTFCRAGLEYFAVTNQAPDVFHIHEWQCAAVALLYWEVYHGRGGGMDRPRVMLTIHNMGNTGEVRQDEFMATGVDGAVFAEIDKALDERTIGHNPERLNLLKGGIVYSNVVTTVSPTYAEETLTQGGAGWLGNVLKKYESKYCGVLNGIDQESWDATVDPALPANFSAQNMGGKALCKKYLQTGLGLEVNPDKPLVACISRLVPQKGIHLIEHAVHVTAQHGGQFVLLGAGHADGGFRSMMNGEYRDSQDVKIMLMYNDALSRLIFAAADIVLVPSMFEPCGLTQMIAMKYGALPLVRSTGGLADTVVDVDHDQTHGNGFSFAGSHQGDIESTLLRAMKRYKEDPSWWRTRAQANVDTDWSWGKSADGYYELYTALQNLD